MELIVRAIEFEIPSRCTIVTAVYRARCEAGNGSETTGNLDGGRTQFFVSLTRSFYQVLTEKTRPHASRALHPSVARKAPVLQLVPTCLPGSIICNAIIVAHRVANSQREIHKVARIHKGRSERVCHRPRLNQ